MRASATSRIASPAVYPSPQVKADAGKTDDASPFAILLNEVVAKPAAAQKDAQNKDPQGSNEKSGSDAASQASGTDSGTQAASQAAVTPAKPDKDGEKSAGNSGDQRADSSASSSAAPAPQQTYAQVPPPAVASQIALIAAAMASATAAGDATDEDASADPAGTAGITPGSRNNTLPIQSGSDTQSTQTAGQNCTPQPANPPAGQATNAQAQSPAPTLNIPLPDGAESPAIQPPGAPAQPPVDAQNIVQPTPPQPGPVPPAPDQTQSVNTAANTVQQDSAQLTVTPSKGAQTQQSEAQNTVQSDTDQPSAAPPTATQIQTPAAQNAVQPRMAQLVQLQPDAPQPQTSSKPVKADKSDDKASKDAGDKGNGGSSDAASAASQSQLSVQPDTSLITTAAANAPTVTAADDDGADQPGVEAAGAAAIAANGSAKPQAAQNTQGVQDTKNFQAALAAPQANAPHGSSQSAPSQTGARADSAKTQNPGANQPQQSQQDANLTSKPWQAKPQNGSGDVTANSGPTSNANPDDVKQAATPAPQASASCNVPVARPVDTGSGNMPIISGAAPQTQQGQSSPATAITQNVQIATPGPNMPALAVEIAARSQSGAKQFDIRLDPPELGRVEVRLSIDATGKASAHVSAAQPQTLDLLQKDAPSLTRALRDAGLNVAQNGLNFSLRQQQGDAGASGNQGRGGNGRSFPLTAVSNIDAAPASAIYRGPADGRLDIRV